MWQHIKLLLQISSEDNVLCVAGMLSSQEKTCAFLPLCYLPMFVLPFCCLPIFVVFRPFYCLPTFVVFRPFYCLPTFVFRPLLSSDLSVAFLSFCGLPTFLQPSYLSVAFLPFCCLPIFLSPSYLSVALLSFCPLLFCIWFSHLCFQNLSHREMISISKHNLVTV